MKYLIILLMATLVSVHQNAQANVVSDSINGIIQNSNNINGNNKNEGNQVQNHSTEKYHDFDAVNSKFAFVVFYRSTCPHCQRFDPILKQFSQDYGFKVYAYTTDGNSLPSFPKSMPMTTTVEKTFFNSPNIEVPSLFLINVKTMKAYLIDQGEMSYQDLNSRVALFFHLFKTQVMN